jgi:hypothetical protein
MTMIRIMMMMTMMIDLPKTRQVHGWSWMLVCIVAAPVDIAGYGESCGCEWENTEGHEKEEDDDDGDFTENVVVS